jgi:hypothetical protein
MRVHPEPEDKEVLSRQLREQVPHSLSFQATHTFALVSGQRCRGRGGGGSGEQGVRGGRGGGHGLYLCVLLMLHYCIAFLAA